MDVLIIGGTGNISSEVASLLATQGHAVTLVTRGRRPVPDSCGHIRADRTDARAFATALKGRRADAAIDFLGYTPDDCALAQRVLRGSVSQYIFISSTVVYRRPAKRLPLTEDSPLGNDHSTYAQNKIACEEFLRNIHGPDFPVTVVRPAYTIGRTRMPSMLCGTDYTLAARIEAGKRVFLHDDGQSLWPIMAASDFAAGLAGLVGNREALGEAFHIASEQALTWNAIYREIGLALGKEPRVVHIPTEMLCRVHPSGNAGLRGDLAEHTVFDNSKTRDLVPEFEPKKSLRTTIRESAAWFNEDASRKRINADTDRLVDLCIDEWRKSQRGEDCAPT